MTEGKPDQQLARFGTDGNPETLHRLSNSNVWVTAPGESPAAATRYFVERPTRAGETELVAYTLDFPIRDVVELAADLRALDALYFATVGPDRYLQDGAAGLIEFLDGLGADAAPVKVPKEPGGDAGRTLVCPRCMAGTVLEVSIDAIDMDAFWCDHCEATWLRREEISEMGAIDFPALMETLGTPPGHDAITVKGPAHLT